MEQMLAEEWLRLRGPTEFGAEAYERFIESGGIKDFSCWPLRPLPESIAIHNMPMSAMTSPADMAYDEEIFEFLSMREVACANPAVMPASLSVV